MRLLRLDLENIGPFDQATVEFLASPEQRPAVTLITGENGTGKTILVDAIRASFGETFATLERSIVRPGKPFRIGLDYALWGGVNHRVLSPGPAGGFASGDDRTTGAARGFDLSLFPFLAEKGTALDLVMSYWRSTMATGGYEIRSLAKPDLKTYLKEALQGTQANAEVTELLCYFDYLRDSRDATERKAGEALYAAAEKIVRISLLDGELSGVLRSTLTPMVRQAGHEVPLANVSSGNAYLIQRMIALLGKMYAVQVLCNKPVEELCQTSGLLLIDEAENHFHPRWQKRFLRDVLSVFPNLQIIATTHSPFILASVPGARVYVCRWDGQRCTVTEETEAYANQPVDDILLSAAFDHAQPFGPEISELLRQRKQAIEAADLPRRRQIEAQLLAKNPDYFSYFQVEERLRSLKEGA